MGQFLCLFGKFRTNKCSYDIVKYYDEGIVLLDPEILKSDQDTDIDFVGICRSYL